jgi:predicted ATPase
MLAFAQLEGLSRSNPVLMIFEDTHWLDPTSLELLGRSVQRLKTLGVFLIVTYRPEFEPPWIGRAYVTALNLNRLAISTSSVFRRRCGGVRSSIGYRPSLDRDSISDNSAAS